MIRSLINTDYFIDDPFIGVEVEGETGIVLLDEYSRGPLSRFRADATLLTSSHEHLSSPHVSIIKTDHC